MIENWEMSSVTLKLADWKLHCRSSCPGVLCKKGVVKSVTKFTGKHQCQSLFFNKVAGLQLY